MPNYQSGMVDPLDPRDRTKASPKLLRVNIMKFISSLITIKMNLHFCLTIYSTLQFLYQTFYYFIIKL